MDRNDPYLILLRRELTRAQARLKRAERERDALREALAALRIPKAEPRDRQEHPATPAARKPIESK